MSTKVSSHYEQQLDSSRRNITYDELNPNTKAVAVSLPSLAPSLCSTAAGAASLQARSGPTCGPHECQVTLQLALILQVSELCILSRATAMSESRTVPAKSTPRANTAGHMSADFNQRQVL